MDKKILGNSDKDINWLGGGAGRLVVKLEIGQVLNCS